MTALLPSEEEAVAADEFAHQQETINGGNAVGDQAGNHLALAAGGLWGSKVTPEIGDLA